MSTDENRFHFLSRRREKGGVRGEEGGREGGRREDFFISFSDAKQLLGITLLNYRGILFPQLFPCRLDDYR